MNPDNSIVGITSRVADAYGLDRQARIDFAFTMGWIWEITGRFDLGQQLDDYMDTLAG